jgi:AcrR family transcriptional regulator
MKGNNDPSSEEPFSYYEVGVKKGWIKPTTQARSRQMCEDILDAAERVFSRQGFDASGVSDITREAGCSVGIFYKRFSDKESLFYTLQYRHNERARVRLDRLPEMRSTLSTSEVLYRFVRASVKGITENAGFERALIERSLKDRKVWQAQRAFNKYAGERLIDFLVARNELPEADRDLKERGHFAARVVFSTILNLVVLGPGPYSVNDDRVVHTLAEFLRGFLHEEQLRLAAK